MRQSIASLQDLSQLIMDYLNDPKKLVEVVNSAQMIGDGAKRQIKFDTQSDVMRVIEQLDKEGVRSTAYTEITGRHSNRLQNAGLSPNDLTRLGYGHVILFESVLMTIDKMAQSKFMNEMSVLAQSGGDVEANVALLKTQHQNEQKELNQSIKAFFSNFLKKKELKELTTCVRLAQERVARYMSQPSVELDKAKRALLFSKLNLYIFEREQKANTLIGRFGPFSKEEKLTAARAAAEALIQGDAIPRECITALNQGELKKIVNSCGYRLNEKTYQLEPCAPATDLYHVLKNQFLDVRTDIKTNISGDLSSNGMSEEDIETQPTQKL